MRLFGSADSRDCMHLSVEASYLSVNGESVCAGADTLTSYLRTEGWPALSLHGDKKQEERTWVLEEFKQGRNPIMVRLSCARLTHLGFASR